MKSPQECAGVWRADIHSCALLKSDTIEHSDIGNWDGSSGVDWLLVAILCTTYIVVRSIHVLRCVARRKFVVGERRTARRRPVSLLDRETSAMTHCADALCMCVPDAVVQATSCRSWISRTFCFM